MGNVLSRSRHGKRPRPHHSSTSPSSLNSLPPPGDGSGNRPAAVSTQSTLSPNVQESPIIAGGQPQPTTTAATSPGLQQDTSHRLSIANVDATPQGEISAVRSPDSLQQSNGHATTLWEKAIDKLEPNDRKELNFDNRDRSEIIAEVLQTVIDKRQKCDKRWTYKKGNGEVIVLRELVDRVFINLEKFAKIGDIVFHNSTDTVSVAWTIFRHLLQVSLQDRQVVGNLLSDLELISRVLGRTAIYEKLYDGIELASAQTLINSLPDLYASILKYLSHSKRYFENIAKNVNRITNSYATEFQLLTEAIKRMEESIEREARTASDDLQISAIVRAEKMCSDRRIAIADLEDMLQSMQQVNEDKLQEICERLEDNERFDILKWLSGIAYERHHEFVSSARQAETGYWLFEKASFTTWKRSSSSSIFWLHGIAGAGKTTLASLVVDTLVKTRKANQAVAYFYCKYDESERQDPDSVLRTIVQQLSLMSPEGSLPEPVVSLYRNHKANGFKSGRLRLGESKKLILELSKAFEQTTIVIDALDECDKKTRIRLVDTLKSLCSLADGLKIFVTSRNDDDILLQLEREPEVYIQSSDNAKDIETFVLAEVERCISQRKLLRGSVSPNLKQAIMETLIKGANGMFLWVHLQIENISRERSETAIRKALQRLPADLDATYSVLWDRICSDTENNCLLAKKTLKWILCAQSPLTTQEIVEAVSIVPMQWTAKADREGVTDMALLDVCQNFLVIDKGLGVFRSAHFSVTEFLQKKLGLTEAHTAAAEICLTLLSCEDNVKSSSQPKNMAEDYVLSDYVLGNWTEHVRLSGGGSDILTNLMKEFFKPSPAYYAWLLTAPERDGDLLPASAEKQLTPLWVVCWYEMWGIFDYVLSSNDDWSICNARGLSPIHVMARRGYDVGLRILLGKDGVDLNCKNDSGDTPLHLAARYGHEAVVKLLLEQEGVDPKCIDKDGDTPLHDAARSGHEGVVKLLLQQGGVDPNCENEIGNTPLLFAARNGNETVVRLLLEHQSADSNSIPKHGETPLHAAARNGHEMVVRLFLEQEGADPNCKNNNCDTPLHVAAYNGHETVVRLLLKWEGVDLNCKNKKGNTPLFFAASNGHVSVLRLLLEYEEAGLNCPGEDGDTLLHAGTQNCHESVVRVLLQQDGVNPNCKNDRGNTPLHDAAFIGREGMVRMLIEHAGVDLNCKGNNGNTPLHIALSSGDETAAKIAILLIKQNGVDLNCKNDFGYTPLFIAAWNGHETVVRLLLAQEGVDPHCRSTAGYTPLYAAARYGRHAAVRILLENEDTDPNCKDHRDDTPLHVAADHGHETVVRLLLQHGVDSNCQNKEGCTPLYYAAKNGNETIVRLLLEQEGVDPNCKTNGGDTPLHAATAAGKSHETVAKLLLQQKGVDPSCKNDIGYTPLFLAAKNGLGTVVSLLLERDGVDPNCKTNYDDTPLHAAAEKGSVAVVRLLLQRENLDFNYKNSSGDTPLVSALRDERMAVVRLLLEKDGVDTNCKCKSGDTPLHFLAGGGYETLIRPILKRGDVDLNHKNEEGATPLYLAAMFGHEAVVRLLLEQKGVDPNCNNMDGITPLHASAFSGNEQIVRLLLQQEGADPNRRDDEGGTPLHFATQYGHGAIVRLLLGMEGVCINSTNGDGETPLDIAVKGGHADIIKALEEAVKARNGNTGGNI